MNSLSESNEKSAIDYKVNIQMMTFIVIIMVMILTLIYFIRIYSGQKEIVLKDMKTEVNFLETIISDHLSYSKHFINTISKNIETDPTNLEHIKKTLHDHFISEDFNTLFGWKKYSWVDQDCLELVTSGTQKNSTPRYLHFMKEIINNIQTNNLNYENEVFFYSSRNLHQNNSLKLIHNIIDKNTQKYIGSIILSYDINTMIRNLNSHKKNATTNFVILNKNLNIVAQSKPTIDNIIDEQDILSKTMLSFLKNLSLKQKNYYESSYLDMINGVNYYIKPLKDAPFIIIVNIDNNIIKHEILSKITKKFIEVCIYALICLFLVISIYKRETILRAKAEKATDIANKATKAKTDFLAFTAHEVRSPLGFILTGSEIMTKELMGKLPESYMKYAEGIHHNSKVILDFITDILDENQIIEGKFNIINSLSDIKDIINEAIKVNLARYNGRDLKLTTEFYEDLPLVVCDRRRMIQVMSNLISNSIKYSKDHTTIKISAMVVGFELEVRVMDQGIGMKPEEIPIALSTYGTVHKTSYHSIGSYGLGLPIVKMLLEAHDAALSITSKEGEGTIVKIVFPKYKLVYNKTKNRSKC